MPTTLFGFTKPVFSSSGNTAKVKRLADNYVKTNTDETGVVSDANVYQEAINILLPYSDDLTVSSKIATYRNSMLKLRNRIEDAENSLVLFKQQTEEGRREVVAGSYQSSTPSMFFSALADFYGAELVQFEDDILSRSLEDLERGRNISSSVLKEQNDLSLKVFSLQTLVNSYIEPDEETGLLGPVEPDAFGVFVVTNPQTGSVIDIQINPVASIEDFPRGFTKTDRRMGRVPVYVNTFGFGEDRKARIGDMSFKIGESDVEGERDIMNLETGFGQKIKELLAIGQAQEAVEEISFDGININSFDIPVDNIVRDLRGNYYHYGADGFLQKFDSLDTAKQYLMQTGKNPRDAEDSVFRVHPDFITQNFVPREDGTQRTITGESLGDITTPSVSSLFVPTGEQAERFSEVANKAGKITGSSVRVQPSREFAGGEYNPRKVLEKGVDIFKPITAPFEKLIGR